jgi:hypothetical protein
MKCASRLGPRPKLDIYIIETIKIGRYDAWWSSSQFLNGYSRGALDLTNGRCSLTVHTYLKSDGLSVRCVKDN